MGDNSQKKSENKYLLKKFQQKLVQSILGWRGFKFVNNMLPTFANILHKTNGPISTKLPNFTQSIPEWLEFKCVQIKDHMHILFLWETLAKRKKDRHLKPYSPES